MKKFVFVLVAVLLTIVPLAAGCTTPPATTPTIPTTGVTQPPAVAEGEITEVSPGEGTITIETGQGEQVFTIGPQTQILYGGRTCSLEELAALQAQGDLSCNVVYETDDEGNVYYVNVEFTPTPASVTGSISDVNVADSTVTVQTAEGPKVFEVNPDTGLLIGGVACSLGLIDALAQDTGTLGDCTVIYDDSNPDQALYIDIANPPDFVQGTGTLTEVSPAASTVTIQTDRGERTFEVDPNTGLFLSGEVCTLEQVTAFTEEGVQTPCQVLYYTDDSGNLIYLDITPP